MIRVEPASGDDPVDLGDMHSRDMGRGRLSSCIYTRVSAQHQSRQDEEKIEITTCTFSQYVLYYVIDVT